jgi:hypothetical protein
MPTLRTLGLTALLLLAGPVQAGDSFTLERKLAKGTRLKVTDHRESEMQQMWTARHTKVGNVEATITHHRYIEEVRNPQPEVFWRDYEESTRSKHHPQDKPNPVNTSLHGRRILVIGLELKPDGPFQIGKPEKDAIKLERLLPVLLPARKVVKLRDSWTVAGKALDEALFGGYAASSGESTAKVTLKAVKEVKGQQIATLKAKIKIHIERASNFPGIDITLKGEVKWAIEASVPVEANFKGTVGVTVIKTEGDDKGEWQASGPTTWQYKAELLDVRKARGDDARAKGLPPPPGTKFLICELQPQHRLDMNHYRACFMCGKKLDKNLECPEGDIWPLQYCPHDGAPLNPGQ